MRSGQRPRLVRPQALFGLAAGTGCVLLVLVGLELHSAASSDALPTRVSAASADASRLAHPADTGASLPPGAVAQFTRVVLARPLFSPQRRPPSVAVSGPQRPRLAGIILGAGGRRAIFAGSGDARGLVVGVGQQAGAWHVIAIDDGGVRVSGPDGVRTLHPSRDKTGGDSAATQAMPAMGSHPSILDLLRSRNAAPGGGGLLGGPMPSPLTLGGQPPQPTAPAAPE